MSRQSKQRGAPVVILLSDRRPVTPPAFQAPQILAILALAIATVLGAGLLTEALTSFVASWSGVQLVYLATL